MTDNVIAQHRARQDELLAASQAILAKADAEKRDLTAEESKELDAGTDEFDRLEAEIKRRERVAAQTAALVAPQPRRAAPDAIDPAAEIENAVRPGDGALPPRQPRAAAGANGGFRTFGDFAQAVRTASARGGQVDPRLLRAAAASTWSGEGAGADGGFAVPADFRAAIMEKVFGEASLIARTDRLTSGANSVTMPVDMTTPWQTTGGIQAYWENEAAALTQSKMVLEQQTMRLHKLAALIPVTEELLEDAPSLDSYLRRKVAAKFDFKLSYALVWGGGVGQPLGFMNAPALVSQAAEGGQTADTIVAANVVKMHARMPTSSIPTAVWLIHPDALAQLPQMVIGDQPVYLPPGGLLAAPFGNMLGRPVIPHQVCKTLGDLGDILFVDFAQYLTIVKSGGLRSDVSIHLWFDQDLTAFKFTMRVAGQPWWSAATAALHGSFTQSPFVALAAR